MARRYIRGTEAERFWPKVDKNGPIPEHRPDLGPCWIWTAGLGHGYGTFHLTGGQIRTSAHRWRSEITHCPHGHEYTAENTYAYRGQRLCKACRTERRRAWSKKRPRAV